MNPFVTNPQSTGFIERALIVWATLAAAKIIAALGLDPGYTDWLAAGILSLGAGAIGWWQNKPSLIAQTIANMSRDQLAQPDVARPLVSAASNVPNPAAPTGKTVVIASPELAAATPAAPTVISSAAHEVVSK